MDDLPLSPDVLAGLAARFEAEWKDHRGHFDPSDKKVDQAIVRVGPTTPFAGIFAVVEALLATKRVIDVGGYGEAVAAFHVSVQPPLPPRPPAVHRLDDGQPPWKGPAPRVRVGQVMISGRLVPDVITRIVAGNEPEVRRCYLDGLRREPRLQGRVSIRFVIGNDGAVSNVGNGGTDLPDMAVIECIVHLFEELAFPRPAGGIVTVIHSYLLSPGR
jgi:hypothetical protein